LSNRDKGPLFSEFIEYTSKPTKIADIESEFGKVPSKTLIAFCLEAGLMVKYGDLVRSIEVKSTVKISEFYSSLAKKYDDLQKNPNRNVPMIYVPIDLMRDLVSLELGLEFPDLFDELLRKTIDSPLGKTIYLHGAPPQVESEFVGFRYKDRRYAYISIR